MSQSNTPPPAQDPHTFLAGGGEMGRLIRSMDWSGTPLGAVESWPQSLRTTVNICLASDLPICVIWGPGLVQIYNDGYRVICGGKHPRSMGQNFAECWKEAWPVIGEAHDSALQGDPAFLESQHIFLDRHGYLEECFFTLSFSPIRDEAGRVGGLFHPVIEMTAKMLGERRTRALRDLAARTSKAKSVSEALSLSALALIEYDLDLPFVLLYELDPDAQLARLVGKTGLVSNTSACPDTVEVGAAGRSIWPVEEAVRSGSAVHVDDVGRRLGPPPYGPYPEPPNAALVLPIFSPGADHPAAIFIAGVSPRLPLDEAYRSFYDLLASGVTTAVTNARAHEDERRRAEALAELDRAKIVFFSNVSHEFRTPLTLMLGPVEDLLDRSRTELSPAVMGQLEVVNRNGLRLLRLVNALLDFSRIEAGRVRAVYQPTDLAAFTAELASVFRAAIERAGLRLAVDCPSLSEPVFVDREMWEKVVLNLLSNAFKFTFEGEIAVTLRRAGRAVELIVRDTGTGVPAAEMPRLFERFHRVENARGRTHEGSGIGLALVQELVKLHGGCITAESVVGTGRGRRSPPPCRWGRPTCRPIKSERAAVSIRPARGPCPTSRRRCGGSPTTCEPEATAARNFRSAVTCCPCRIPASGAKTTGPVCWWPTTTPTCGSTSSACWPSITAPKPCRTGRRHWRRHGTGPRT
jgi:signal transduction histidine kinase